MVGKKIVHVNVFIAIDTIHIYLEMCSSHVCILFEVLHCLFNMVNNRRQIHQGDVAQW